RSAPDTCNAWQPHRKAGQPCRSVNRPLTTHPANFALQGESRLRASRAMTDVTAAQTAATGLKWPGLADFGTLLRRGDLALAIAVLAILVVLVLPLPPLLLDLALALSIIFSVLIL